MPDDAARTCDAPTCDRALDVDAPELVFDGWLGEQRAYQCDCGAVTITTPAVVSEDGSRHG